MLQLVHSRFHDFLTCDKIPTTRTPYARDLAACLSLSVKLYFQNPPNLIAALHSTSDVAVSYITLTATSPSLAPFRECLQDSTHLSSFLYSSLTWIVAHLNTTYIYRHVVSRHCAPAIIATSTSAQDLPTSHGVIRANYTSSLSWPISLVHIFIVT